MRNMYMYTHQVYVHTPNNKVSKLYLSYPKRALSPNIPNSKVSELCLSYHKRDIYKKQDF